jgi:hypothetical protein
MNGACLCLSSFKIGDEEGLLQAISSLSLSSDSSSDNLACFTLLMDHWTQLSAASYTAVLKAAEREFTQRTLPWNQRLRLFDLIAQDFADKRDHRLLFVINAAARRVSSATEFDPILARAYQFLRRTAPGHAELSAAILKGLIENGYVPDKKLFNLLCTRPAVLRAIARPMMQQIELQLPPESAEAYIGGIVKTVKMDTKVLEAVFELTNPPASILGQIEQMVKMQVVQPGLVTMLMRCSKRVVELGVISLGDLIEKAIGVSGKEFVFPAEFFSRLSDADFARVPNEMWLLLWDCFATVSNRNAYRFVVEAVKRSRLFWEKALAFFMLRESSGRLEEWASALTAILPIVDAEFQDRVHAIVYELTICELTFGHITDSTGLKLIQTTRAQRQNPQFLRDFDLDGVSRRRAGAEDGGEAVLPQVQLRGWRELALLLRLARPTAETLELMMRAIDIHERALGPTFAEILKGYSKLIVVNWLERLFAGRQARQLLALEILWQLARSCSTLWDFLALVLRRYTSGPGVPDLVGAKALRILREIFDAKLPAEIIGLFDRPSIGCLRSAGQREAWRVGVSASMTVKGEVRLPSLAPTRSIGGLIASSSLSRKLTLIGTLPYASSRRPAFLHPQ